MQHVACRAVKHRQPRAWRHDEGDTCRVSEDGRRPATKANRRLSIHTCPCGCRPKRNANVPYSRAASGSRNGKSSGTRLSPTTAAGRNGRPSYTRTRLRLPPKDRLGEGRCRQLNPESASQGRRSRQAGRVCLPPGQRQRLCSGGGGEQRDSVKIHQTVSRFIRRRSVSEDVCWR